MRWRAASTSARSGAGGTVMARVYHGPSAAVSQRAGPGRSGAGDDRGERGQLVVRGDQVGQAEPLAPGLEILADLGHAADEDGRHLPHVLGSDPAPAAPRDEFLGARAPPRGDAEHAERAELQLPEPVTGRRAQDGELVIQRRWQPVERVVAIFGAPDRGPPAPISRRGQPRRWGSTSRSRPSIWYQVPE